MPHIVDTRLFTRQVLQQLFEIAEKEMRPIVKKGGCDILKGKSFYNLFDEPSTRTMGSFHQSASLLGCSVFNVHGAAHFSSFAKNESIADTVRVAEAQGFNALAFRYGSEQGIHEAVSAAERMVLINAGSGANEHPTQAGLDALTIMQEFGTLDGLTLGFVGDCRNSRTIRSLIRLAVQYEIKQVYFAAPEMFYPSDDILKLLALHSIPYVLSRNVSHIAPHVDVLYVTRIQWERMRGSQKLLWRLQRAKFHEAFVVDEHVVGMLRKEAIVIHPLPRVSRKWCELTPETDKNYRSRIWKQVENGNLFRMALLAALLAPREYPVFSTADAIYPRLIPASS